MGFTNIEGVAGEWDACPEIRDRLRDGQAPIQTPAGQDITTCVKVSGLLVPLLTRMATETKKTVPSIDQLKDELEKLLLKNKRGADTGGVDVPNCARALRKLCGMVKTKARRAEVSTATGLQTQRHKLHGFKRNFWILASSLFQLVLVLTFGWLWIVLFLLGWVLLANCFNNL